MSTVTFPADLARLDWASALELDWKVEALVDQNEKGRKRRFNRLACARLLLSYTPGLLIGGEEWVGIRIIWEQVLWYCMNRHQSDPIGILESFNRFRGVVYRIAGDSFVVPCFSFWTEFGSIYVR